MTVEDIVKSFKEKPYMLKMGSRNVAHRLHCNVEDVKKARVKIKTPAKFPKILIYDIETAPLTAYVWRRWKENISLDQTISEWFMLCWSAKWLYSADVMGECLTPEEAINQDDKRIVKKLWELIDAADIVIAYNGKKADIPWMNTRFIVNGLMPPKPYFIIDPCEVARKKFGFSSNKLDALAGYFNIEHKMDTDFNLWKQCMEGNKESLEYMLEYNKKDSVILEEVYLKMRPWITNHPNIANYCEIDCCTKCGSSIYEEIKGEYYVTSVNKYKLFRCKDCGTIFRSRRPVSKSNISNRNI